MAAQKQRKIVGLTFGFIEYLLTENLTNQDSQLS